MSAKEHTLYAAINFLALFAILTGLVFFVPDAVEYFDSLINQFFSSIRTPAGMQSMLLMTYAAHPEIIIAFQTVILVLLAAIHRKRLAALFLSGLVVGQSLSLLFKDLIERARPEVLVDTLQHGYAFPSGHALISIVIYGFTAYVIVSASKNHTVKVVTVLAAVFLIGAIGVSRVYIGVHWATDVIGGWLIGASLLLMLIYAYERVRFFRNAHSRVRFHITALMGLMIVITGVFLSYFFVTHMHELRSIVYVTYLIQ